MKIVIERFGSLVRATCIAPDGQLWISGRVHELVSEARGGKEATANVRKDIKERISLGYSKCDIEDCDWCNGY